MLKRYKLLLLDGTWSKWFDAETEPIELNIEKWIKGLIIEEDVTVEQFKKDFPELATK